MSETLNNMSLLEVLMVVSAVTGAFVTMVIAVAYSKFKAWVNKEEAVKETKKKKEPAKKKYKEYCEEYVGDVLVIIEEYEDIEVVTYDNTVYESINALLRSEESLSTYEVEELKKLNRTLKQLRGEKAPKKEEATGELQCDVVSSDLHGDIVILNAPQAVELGNKGRMKAWIDFRQEKEGELPFMFIKEIHIINEGKQKKGKFATYSNPSVTPYYLRDDEGKENKEQKDIFFARFLQSDSEDWEEERNDYNELQELLRHYNTHRHLLKWDDEMGQWLVLPASPKQVEKEVAPKQEEAKTEAVPKPKEELEMEVKEESKTEAVSVEELSDEEVVINMLQQLSKGQLSILISIIKSGLQETKQNKEEETTMEAAFKKALSKKDAE